MMLQKYTGRNMDETELAKNFGALLKNLPPKHAREYTQGLTLDENTIIQKLISDDILNVKIKMQYGDGKTKTHTGIRVQSKDYLKALIFLDYYSTVLDESMSACENAVTLAIKIRELTQKESHDKMISELNLETVVLETGLVAQQRFSENPDYSQPDNITMISDITRRYNQNNAFIGSAHPRKSEPYYQAIGLRMVEMVSPERRRYLDDVISRSDLGAVIFTDGVLEVLKNRETIELTEQYLLENKLKASIHALSAIRDEASLERLGNAIRRDYHERD